MTTRKSKTLHYLKLSTGDELIAEVEFNERGVVTLVNPFRLIHIYAEGVLLPQFHPLIYGQYFLTTQIHANDLVIAAEPGEHLSFLYHDFISQLSADIRPRGTILH
jgi:hypothetical protein